MSSGVHGHVAIYGASVCDYFGGVHHTNARGYDHTSVNKYLNLLLF